MLHVILFDGKCLLIRKMSTILTVMTMMMVMMFDLCRQTRGKEGANLPLQLLILNLRIQMIAQLTSWITIFLKLELELPQNQYICISGLMEQLLSTHARSTIYYSISVEFMSS